MRALAVFFGVALILTVIPPGMIIPDEGADGFCGILRCSLPGVASAEDKKYPYGGSQSGVYGQKKKVETKGDAEKILMEYFADKQVKTGEIREKEYYFEADIMDKNGEVIDKVIVDKRTGRIRSIY